MAADFCPLRGQPGLTSATGENPGDESLYFASQWIHVVWGAPTLSLDKAGLPLASGTRVGARGA